MVPIISVVSFARARLQRIESKNEKKKSSKSKNWWTSQIFLAISTFSPVSSWSLNSKRERERVCVCACVVCMHGSVCVCVSECGINLKRTLRQHVHISVHCILCHTHILIPFEDHKLIGLKMDIANSFFLLFNENHRHHSQVSCTGPWLTCPGSPQSWVGTCGWPPSGWRWRRPACGWKSRWQWGGQSRRRRWWWTWSGRSAAPWAACPASPSSCCWGTLQTERVVTLTVVCEAKTSLSQLSVKLKLHSHSCLWS